MNGLPCNYLKPAGKPFKGRNRPARTKPRAKSKKQRERDKIYAKLRKQLLFERPICEAWLQENGYVQVSFAGEESMFCKGKVEYRFSHLMFKGALRSEECHHKRGRGRYYLDYSTFMAVSASWHRWITDHGAEAEAKGWLDPRRNSRKAV